MAPLRPSRQPPPRAPAADEGPSATTLEFHCKRLAEQAAHVTGCPHDTKSTPAPHVAICTACGCYSVDAGITWQTPTRHKRLADLVVAAGRDVPAIDLKTASRRRR